MNEPRDDAFEPVSARPVSEPPPASRRARVWVIDDSPLQAEMARDALKGLFDVSTFTSSSAALEHLSLQSMPDVLVLDWRMPDMSGKETCHFIRRKFDEAQLPILVLTVADSREAVLEALGAGANDFVRKPFTHEELNARVGILARASQQHARLMEMEQTLRVEAEFRERFIGMLAHDLRQPLNTVALAAHLRAGEQSSKSAEIHARAVQRMKRMIGELLDFTRNRPETGMPLERQPVDFGELTAATIEEIRTAHPGVALQLSVDGACTGHWDADRLAQLCSNLVGNAIEHRHPDTPVEVSLQSSETEVVLSVFNQGPRIPTAVHATLFEPFRRGKTAKTSGGVGLGLHIVSQIVRLHDGKVRVESSDQGTRFVVTLRKDAPPKV